MKLKLLKTSYLAIALFLFILTTTGCKKDKIEVNEVKEYIQLLQVPL